MKEISQEYARNHNLKKIGEIIENDMSKVILMIERLKQNKKIEYYCMDIIVFDPKKHKARIQVSFWGS